MLDFTVQPYYCSVTGTIKHNNPPWFEHSYTQCEVVKVHCVILPVEVDCCNQTLSHLVVSRGWSESCCCAQTNHRWTMKQTLNDWKMKNNNRIIDVLLRENRVVWNCARGDDKSFSSRSFSNKSLLIMLEQRIWCLTTRAVKPLTFDSNQLRMFTRTARCLAPQLG